MNKSYVRCVANDISNISWQLCKILSKKGTHPPFSLSSAFQIDLKLKI